VEKLACLLRVCEPYDLLLLEVQNNLSPTGELRIAVLEVMVQLVEWDRKRQE
jgi:hypothetical protein